MLNASFDIESLDTEPTANVISIGMCIFDDTVPTFVPFLTKLWIINDEFQKNRTIGKDTTEFWGQQPPAAQLACGLSIDGAEQVTPVTPCSIRTAFREINEAFHQYDVKRTWGWPATFDLTILKTFEFNPFNGRNTYCGRTLFKLLNEVGVQIPRARAVNKHHADSDALAQAETIYNCIKYLTK